VATPWRIRYERRELHQIDDLATAVQVYAVIGGVAAYAREMVANDVPLAPQELDRWLCHRVLSPASPLLGEVELLFGEDPLVSTARKPNLHHATLADVALGNHAWGSLTNYVRIPGASLQAIMDALVAADFIARVQDPVRDNRPTYHPSDPLIRFHYAVIRRHQAGPGRHGVDTMALWAELITTFRSQVLGPCFESMARYWTTHFADRATLGGMAEHVGPTMLPVPNDETGAVEIRKVDVVVAADDGNTPGARTVCALGEAKAGERITMRHVHRLEVARSAMGARADGARLLLFGQLFDDEVRQAQATRADVEVIDLDRLYAGS